MTIKLPVTVDYVPELRDFAVTDADGSYPTLSQIADALNAAAPDLTELKLVWEEWREVTKAYNRGNVEFGDVVAGLFGVAAAVNAIFPDKDNTP